MHILDATRFYEVLKRKGYRSIGSLALQLKIHRNTIHHYLSGHGVFPENLERILDALDLSPADIIIRKREEQTSPLAQIAPLIDALQKSFPEITFVLFGSRAKGAAQKYSDWDIGVYLSQGIAHDVYRRIVRQGKELAESAPYAIDIVNLSRADEPFLREASRGWQFLGGSLEGWCALQRKAAV